MEKAATSDELRTKVPDSVLRMKILKRLVIALVLLLVVAAIVVYAFIDPLLRTAIERGATYGTGVETKLGGVDAGLVSGHLGLTRLEIANPPGFRPEPFLNLASAQAAWSNRSIFSDRIEVERLDLSGVEINLERTDGKTNYGVILANLENISGGGKTGQPSEPGAKKNLTIHHIEIRDVKAGLHLSGIPIASGSMNVSMPVIAIDDFKSDGSTHEIVAKLVRVLVQSILEGALKAGKGIFPADFVKDLGGNLDQMKDQVAKEAEKLLQGADKNLKKSVEDALKNAGDLFKKK